MSALDHVTEIYHASVRLHSDDLTVYVDPFHISRHYEDADIVVITHTHGDHYSAPDIQKVLKEDTTFITTYEGAAKLQADLGIRDEYIVVLQWDSPTVYFEDGISVQPVIAENKNHSVEFGFGAVVEIGGYTYYFSGDTDVLADDVVCDILFVVCDGQYNMPNFTQLAVAQVLAMDTMPKLVVPYHYGYIENTTDNGKLLAEALTAANIPNKLLYTA